MTLANGWKQLLIDTAKKLKRSARRVFMAATVRALGKGGQRKAGLELGWGRDTIRKGEHELRTGFECVDACSLRGAKPVEVRLPNLREDIRAIVEEQTQTDPTFRTKRLYRRMTAREVRHQLVLQKGYREEDLPGEEAIRRRLNTMGYWPMKVRKSKPKKKIPQTDAIFDELKRVHKEADDDEGTLRVSMDTKAAVKVGEFSRRGKSRVSVAALDHDHGADAVIVPVGIVLPKHDELSISFVESKVTSDCLVDVLQDWWEANRERFPEVHTLLLNQDNGPENNSRRTQFVKRMVEFVDKNQIDVLLAYYPPYHSKYNPIERCWGVLENYWNGSLLDTVSGALELAGAMRWKGRHPVIELVTRTYKTGVRLSKKVMNAVEERLTRLAGLEKWFVEIRHQPQTG